MGRKHHISIKRIFVLISIAVMLICNVLIYTSAEEPILPDMEMIQDIGELIDTDGEEYTEAQEQQEETAPVYEEYLPDEPVMQEPDVPETEIFMEYIPEPETEPETEYFEPETQAAPQELPIEQEYTEPEQAEPETQEEIPVEIEPETWFPDESIQEELPVQEQVTEMQEETAVSDSAAQDVVPEDEPAQEVQPRFVINGYAADSNAYYEYNRDSETDREYFAFFDRVFPGCAVENAFYIYEEQLQPAYNYDVTVNGFDIKDKWFLAHLLDGKDLENIEGRTVYQYNDYQADGTVAPVYFELLEYTYKQDTKSLQYQAKSMQNFIILNDFHAEWYFVYTPVVEEPETIALPVEEVPAADGQEETVPDMMEESEPETQQDIVIMMEDETTAAEEMETTQPPEDETLYVPEESVIDDESPPQKTVYEYEDNTVYVRATLSDPSVIPDNAILQVSQINNEEAENYLEQLNGQTDNASAYSSENTLLYDISFYVPVIRETESATTQGDTVSVPVEEYEEIEPEEGTVSIILQFKTAQLTNELRVQDVQAIEVNHFASDGTVSTMDTEQAVAGDNHDMDQVAFTTDSFSVYAVSYLVDFWYGVDGQEYGYHISGGDTVALMDIIEALHVVELDDEQVTRERFLSDITDVTFSNPAYINIMEQDGGWILESLEPFSTEETLSVTMKSGEQFTIRVTDAQLFRYVITADGSEYSITATYAEETGIPENAVLQVEEIPGNTSEYDNYLSMAMNAVGAENRNAAYARFFDIKILDGSGNEVNPAEGTTVNVSVTLEDRQDSEAMEVVHFGDTTDVIPAETENGTTVFEASSFSVYSLLELELPEEAGNREVETVDELDGNGFYMSVTLPTSTKTYYFRNHIADKNKIAKTSPNVVETAALWYFEKVSGTDNQFKLYTYDSNDQKIYMVMNNSGNMSVSEEDGTEFTVELYDSSVPGDFYIYKQVGTKKYGLNMFNGESGKGFAGWTGKDDGSKIRLRLPLNIVPDMLGLNRKTYVLVNYKSSVSGIAMTTEQMSNNTHMKAVELLLRNNPLRNNETLFVANDEALLEWTFWHIEDNKYYITADVDGEMKYLHVTSSAVTLVDTPDEYCVLDVAMGSGAMDGKIRISNKDNYAPNLYGGSLSRGFGSYNDSGVNEWFNLAEESDLAAEDFVRYTAHKVSISDTTHVHNGSQVIVYTRIWNPTTKKYDFYVVDHEGNLMYAFANGDSLQWVGLQVNNALWDFTEYYYEGTETPNYYYELQNAYSGKYLAPRMDSENVLSDTPVGINLNGRRYGDYYSTILAWDDPHYDYASYRIQDDGIVPCSFSQAMDFYFAVADFDNDQLTTVDTVDNTPYGITMKMIDYNGEKYERNSYDYTQTNIIGNTQDKAGLVSTNLDEYGYPVATATGLSLSALYNGAQDVNHLFLSSVYSESGYFEYKSTANFAHLNPNGNFTVYDQIGTINKTGGQSLDHGQFMPYNDLHEGEFSPYLTNQTDVNDKPLSGLDPRKGMALYKIPFNEGGENEANYHFGMEMEASFIQTVHGLDAWGHDIIFEFSGDDDMWFYVDGELVLDLGGIHAAMTGSINFRTGEIKTNKRGNTTLYNVFKANYEQRNPEASSEEVLAYLDEIFEQNSAGQYVFKDYSRHTMKMFYMERGAGGSNLEMRFNLTSIKPGTVVLKKAISGTDRSDYKFAEFPFQVYYRLQDEETFRLLEQDNENIRVTYEGTNTPVKHMDSFTPTGKTDSYAHVYFLKPDQAATVYIPDETIEYYIVECGVDPNIYNSVDVNDDTVTGVDANGDGLFDYDSGIDTVVNRPMVEYDNHVNPNKLRTLVIKKRLFAEDGTTELFQADDPQTFDFRLYLGSETDTDPSLVYMEHYYVKDNANRYCVFENGGFVSTGKTDFSRLTAAEKQRASFTTSANGAISKIPAGYSIELRDLIVGTKFKVEERASEIPDGYKLKEYYRVNGSYIAEDGDTLNSGIIRDNSNPVIEVCNQRGFSLTAEKVWSDNDFVSYHGDIYFAVYAGSSQTPLPGTVRRISNTERSVQYYFDSLEPGCGFEDYRIAEVRLENPVTDPDTGIVTSYSSITPLSEDDVIPVDSTLNGDTQPASQRYEVHYATGEPTGTVNNIRTDTVSNVREGIRLEKTDWAGNPLQGAVFTLTEQDGTVVGSQSYTSGADGLITTAYVNDGTYILTETSAPLGYCGLSNPVTFTVEEGQIQIVSADEGYAVCDNQGSPVLTVKNRPFTLKAVKTDAETGEPLENAVFTLYRQVIGGNGLPRKDYIALTGYENVVSAANGCIAENLEQLPVGTYYIVEKNAPEEYIKITADETFTIDQTGHVTLANHANYSLETDETGLVLAYCIKAGNVKDNTTYTLAVGNTVRGSLGSKIKDFHYTLSLEGLAAGRPVMYSINGSQEQAVSWNSGQFAFTLKHGDEIVFTGIPRNTAYEVVELDANQDGYTTTDSGNTSGTITDNTVVSFVNARDAAIPTDLFDHNKDVALFAVLGAGAVIAALLVLSRAKSKNTDKNK